MTAFSCHFHFDQGTSSMSYSHFHIGRLADNHPIWINRIFCKQQTDCFTVIIFFHNRSRYINGCIFWNTHFFCYISAVNRSYQRAFHIYRTTSVKLSIFDNTAIWIIRPLICINNRYCIHVGIKQYFFRTMSDPSKNISCSIYCNLIISKLFHFGFYKLGYALFITGHTFCLHDLLGKCNCIIFDPFKNFVHISAHFISPFLHSLKRSINGWPSVLPLEWSPLDKLGNYHKYSCCQCPHSKQWKHTLDPFIIWYMSQCDSCHKVSTYRIENV